MKKTISFIVKLPDSYYKFTLTKRHKCTIIEPIESAEENVRTKNIAPNQLVYAVKEFNILDRFRRRIFNLLSQLNTTVLFHIVEPINGGLIDYAWCKRALIATWEMVEIDNLSSWLSTLGGGFSSLGDTFEKCADRAGRISQYQLRLASKTGNPSIIARCKLYYSISLIQKGKFRAAQKLILSQYEYAKQRRLAGDSLVYKMCHGIWLKLQYSHSAALQNKKKHLRT